MAVRARHAGLPDDFIAKHRRLTPEATRQIVAITTCVVATPSRTAQSQLFVGVQFTHGEKHEEVFGSAGTRAGGGLANTGSALLVADTLAHNSAGANGGGIANRGAHLAYLRKVQRNSEYLRVQGDGRHLTHRYAGVSAIAENRR